MKTRINFCDASRLKTQLQYSDNQNTVTWDELQKYLVTPGKLSMTPDLNQSCYCTSTPCTTDPSKCRATLQTHAASANKRNIYNPEHRFLIFGVQQDIAVIKPALGRLTCATSKQWSPVPALYRLRHMSVQQDKIAVAPQCMVHFNGQSEEVFSIGMGRTFVTSAVVKSTRHAY